MYIYLICHISVTFFYFCCEEYILFHLCCVHLPALIPLAPPRWRHAQTFPDWPDAPTCPEAACLTWLQLFPTCSVRVSFTSKNSGEERAARPGWTDLNTASLLSTSAVSFEEITLPEVCVFVLYSGTEEIQVMRKKFRLICVWAIYEYKFYFFMLLFDFFLKLMMFYECEWPHVNTQCPPVSLICTLGQSVYIIGRIFPHMTSITNNNPFVMLSGSPMFLIKDDT